MIYNKIMTLSPSATTSTSSLTRHVFQFHRFHLVSLSPWPILVAHSVYRLMAGGVLYMHGIDSGFQFMMLGFFTTLFAFTLWFKDVVTEGTHLGDHTSNVQKGITIGVSLFILSEVFFFLTIFWRYFHSALAPTVELGSQWPPAGIVSLDPTTIPLLNTILLLSSGATITLAHHSLIHGGRSILLLGSALTVILAVVFTSLQGLEYGTAGFTMADSVYGSSFFFSTGFHGLHVIIGTIFIFVGLCRAYLYHFTPAHHVGYESGIFYWHFVDVVWIGLYGAVYWWGSQLFGTMAATRVVASLGNVGPTAKIVELYSLVSKNSTVSKDV